MRVAVPFSLFLMLAMFLQPACQAAEPLVPILTLTIDPPSQNVSSLAYAPVSISFNGTVSMRKTPVNRYMVDMSASVDAGWSANVAPPQMLLTSSSTMQFTAYVTIPIGTPNMTGILTVNGHAEGAVEDSFANVTAIIYVTGVQIVNQTASNQTAKHTTSGTGALANIGGSTVITISVTAVIIASVAVVGSVIYKKRKGRRIEPEA